MSGRHLQAADPEEVETTLLIHPGVLEDFLDYNDFLDVADAAVASFPETERIYEKNIETLRRLATRGGGGCGSRSDRSCRRRDL